MHAARWTTTTRSAAAALLASALVGCGDDRVRRDPEAERALERELAPVLDALDRRLEEEERRVGIPDEGASAGPDAGDAAPSTAR